MKIFRCFLALVLLCGLMGTAKADVLDFQFSIQDPLPVTLTETLVFANTPFAVAFGACQLGEAANGCFYGLNKSTVTLTTLDITFINTIGPADSPDFLNSQPADCVTTVAGSQFSEAPICGLSSDNKTYDLFFRGTPGIAPDTVFTIEEVGPNPDAFQGGSAIANETPEPGSIVLMSSGAAFFGMLLRKYRRESSTSTV
jgi:hypothetical protein